MVAAGLGADWRALRLTILSLVMLALLATLGGCGWHLRGSQTVELSLPPVYLQAEHISQALRLALHRRLLANDIKLLKQRELAEIVLTIETEKSDRRVLSLDRSGKVQAYELQYSVRFSVKTIEGEWLLNSETLSTQRDYSFDESDVLAKNKEQEELFTVMRTNVVDQLLRRLQSQLNAN